MISQEVADKHQQAEEIVGSAHNIDSHCILFLGQGRDNWDRTVKKDRSLECLFTCIMLLNKN